ncbi:CoA-binding protein [Balneatrix alpica]|uniref:CoA-binding protein n=1 Tax=Balneatrix alpica TaxID=75684 RepID=A0ABV5ZFZ9_9GAMM|nr:CoA-binding protein [Balneatrix alpica]
MTGAVASLKYADEEIRDILEEVSVIALVGASPNPERPSYTVMKYLLHKGYRVIPVNPNEAGKEILGEEVFASLADIGEPVDMVDIFRRSETVMEVVEQAIEIGARVVWMQLDVVNEEAAAKAEEAGLRVVMDRCPKIEYERLRLGRG